MENKPKTAKKTSSSLLPTSKKIKKEAVPVKKNKGDIDDIFSTLKDKPKKVNTEEATENKDVKKNKALKKTGNRKQKTTEEGFKIYTVDELKIGQGEGDTDLCPFDCNCCF